MADFIEPVLATPETHERLTAVCEGTTTRFPYPKGMGKIGDKFRMHSTEAGYGFEATLAGVYTVTRIEPWSDDRG